MFVLYGILGLISLGVYRRSRFRASHVSSASPAAFAASKNCSRCRAAELAKLLENTFRHVNIALANEMAMLCHEVDIDVWEVVDAAATKPFGFMPFYPGPGLGGHCIPIDPFYLSWKVKEVGFEARFIELAGHVNNAMPLHVVEKINDALNTRSKSIRGSSVLILGISYKRDIDDMRESPALDVMALLQQKGARISYHDPFVRKLAARDWPGDLDLASVALTPDALRSADCAVIITDHKAFDYKMITRDASLIVDSRNAIKAAHPHVFKLGAPTKNASLLQEAVTSTSNRD
jgi:UDP-N-acetyl-D-glucosamine dehydrogenase